MKQTKMSVNEAKEAVKTFIKMFGAGIIAFVLLILAGMGNAPEVILLTAILIAVNQYFKNKGFYEKTAKMVGIKK
jgi:hypothetical protein